MTWHQPYSQNNHRELFIPSSLADFVWQPSRPRRVDWSSVRVRTQMAADATGGVRGTPTHQLLGQSPPSGRRGSPTGATYCLKPPLFVRDGMLDHFPGHTREGGLFEDDEAGFEEILWLGEPSGPSSPPAFRQLFDEPQSAPPLRRLSKSVMGTSSSPTTRGHATLRPSPRRAWLGSLLHREASDFKLVQTTLGG